MATKYYIDDNAAPESPSYDGGWEDPAQAAIRKLLALSSEWSGQPAGIPYIVNPSGSANRDYLWIQLVSGTIAAQTIGGGGATIRGVHWMREDSASNDARAQLLVKVVSNDGTTVRGTALAMDTAAVGADEFVSAYETRYIPRGGAQTLSSVTAQAGDRIVIEVGFRAHSTGTGDTRFVGTDDTPDVAFTEGLTGTTARGWFEFSQNITPYVVSATAGHASGTGAAYNATISNVAPDRSIAVNSVNLAAKIRFDSFSFTETADQGSVGIGGFSVDDSTAALDIPALKPVTFTEYRASEPRLFSGFTQQRSTQRGPNKVAGQREWDVECVDINVLFDDYVMTGAGANRGAETDYARVTWLLTTALNTVGGVTAGVVPNSNTVDMDEVDYRGRKARDVIAECAEASGKNYFIYYHASGPLLFYDLHTSSSLASSARISDVAADVDSSVTWAALGPPKVLKTPDRVYSTVHLKYKRGTKIVSSASTLANFRRRDIALTDLSVKSSAKALAKANRYLDGPASTELVSVSEVSVDVPAANVNDIRAGDRIEIKLTRHGISSFTWYRILRRTVTASSDVRYRLTLQLSDTVLPSIFIHGRGGEDIWEEKSNATEDDATVIVDGGGITVTNGAITVTNGASVVIIDGTSDIFKIAAEGTQSVTATADDTNTGSTTLTALGALAASPASLLLQSNGNLSTSLQAPGIMIGGQSLLWVAQTSGGAVNDSRWLTSHFAFGYVALNGSDEAVVTISCANSTGSSVTYYQKYFVLIETGF